MDVTSYLLGKKAGGGGGSNFQSKSVEITENGTTNVKPDAGYDALKNVNVTVSGILDTSDADAVASDIAMSKTAYVNGNKVTGNVRVGSSSMSTNYSASDVGTYLDDLQVDTEQGNINQMFRTGDKISVFAPLSDVATVVGATANKIKKDEVICGVTGTYEGGGGASLDLSTGIKFAYSSFSTLPTIIANANWEDISNGNFMFYGCNSLTTIPLINTSNITQLNDAFEDCGNLVSIPLIDTSSVTEMGNIFSNCYNLTTIPQLDTSSCINMADAFSYCEDLSNTSLNNILGMCINVNDDYYGDKTLLAIGLTEEQANTCKTLSNYNTFLSAGWTTGYGEELNSYTVYVDFTQLDETDGPGSFYSVGEIDYDLYNELYSGNEINLTLSDNNSTEVVGSVSSSGEFTANDGSLQFSISVYEEDEEDEETGEIVPLGTYQMEFWDISHSA